MHPQRRGCYPPRKSVASPVLMVLAAALAMGQPAAGNEAEMQSATGDPDSRLNDDPTSSASAEPMRAEPEMLESSPVTDADRLSVLPATLTPADVAASVLTFYPTIAQARQLRNLAAGELTAAFGTYDLNLQTHSYAEPTGFYENYRNGISIARQTWWGKDLYAGYRIGRGSFQPWYKERQTDDAGEIKLGFKQPLMQGRVIDKERVQVLQADLELQKADPQLREVMLSVSLQAALAYWDWVAAGALLEAQQALVQLAVNRAEQIQAGFEAGRYADVDVLLNRQLIAERRTEMLATQRKYLQSALKLSLFIRDDAGEPMLPSDQWRPQSFPEMPLPAPDQLNDQIASALSRRPEIERLQLERRQLGLEAQLARNLMLPRFDLAVEGSQDLGPPATKADDKDQFLLLIGATTEVPVERRMARGKRRAVAAKLAQLDAKQRLQRDKIAVEIKSAYAAMQVSERAVRQAREAQVTAEETVDRYRFAFERGNVDLLYLNLLEVKSNEALLKLIKAQQELAEATARYETARGIIPQ